MSALAEEAARLVDMLPPEKARALIELARYLAEKADDEEWDRQFNDRKYEKKLGARIAEVREAMKKGDVEPLDLDKL